MPLAALTNGEIQIDHPSPSQHYLRMMRSTASPPTSLLDPPQKAPNHFNDRLTSAINRFQNRVRNYNHGVRESNVLEMLLPIGVDALALDITWLQDLDSWAKERGQIAHQSSGKIQTKLDPAREYTRVKTLLDGFKTIDSTISRLP